MFTGLQVRILQWISPGPPAWSTVSIYDGKCKIGMLFGDEFLASLAGKTVVDFCCGEGLEAVEMVRRGARRVIGIDIREDVLQQARDNARIAGVEETCEFVSSTDNPADVVVSIDSFEHFSDPAKVLDLMDNLLQPCGEVLVSFGPTWYHPLGGHLFSVFPWAHLLFSEKALIRWRSGFKTDGATRFGEVAGGLNQMTIGRFEKLVKQSAFRFASMELVPIRKLRPFHNRLTREFTTALVRCRLIKQTG